MVLFLLSVLLISLIMTPTHKKIIKLQLNANNNNNDNDNNNNDNRNNNNPHYIDNIDVQYNTKYGLIFM